MLATTTSNRSQKGVVSLAPNRLSNLSNKSSNTDATNSTTATNNMHPFSSITSQTITSVNTTATTNQQSFANNMIAKLASASSQKSMTKQPASSALSSQSKRKRSKLLDMLLNTNWSKHSQQANNLIKFNKILLVCDVNFLDEKTGESPLSLAISSPQINATTSGSLSNGGNGQALSIPTTIGCPQSASLFNLQCHSTASHNQLTLQQTSAADICQSKTPLVERILLLLIKSGALIDFRNKDGRTPLHVAAMKSNFWALKTLLDLGASADYRDINGLTPLYYSILHRAELKVTQLLLNHNNRNPSSLSSFDSDGTTASSIGITDQHGWQEVHQACKLGLDAHLDKLLYHGCDINAKISGSGNTPLHVAAINDQLNCARVLLLRGADKTITNNSHQTAHQVAVISNNMDLAEFIAEHDDTKVVPFTERPTNFGSRSLSIAAYNRNDKSSQFSTSSSLQLVSSHSSANLSQIHYNQQPNCTGFGRHQPQQFDQQRQQSGSQINPLTLDVTAHTTESGGSAASSAPTSTCGSSGRVTSQSLLAINANHQNQQLNVQVNNISPCLSQRSCATSTNTTTTSSSGVCCDGDGINSAEELAHSQSRHSNITVISISNNVDSSGSSSINNKIDKISNQGTSLSKSFRAHNTDSDDFVANGHNTLMAETENVNDEDDDDEDPRSSESSNELYSLMSEERPLFAGSLVEATSDYQSGDPNHLQLRRGDVIEVLEYPPELVQGGQLPRLANKPLLFGQHKSDELLGLFPSFCVRRCKQRQRATLRQRNAMTDVTNLNPTQLQQSGSTVTNDQYSGQGGIRGANLPESQSMVALDQQQQKMEANKGEDCQQAGTNFKEFQVTLTKFNEGFGFVLRGARIDPTTLTAQPNCQTGKITIDERLMAANNLASLQYLDDIELGSVAQQAGLKRGDFLIAVNRQDVRTCSHEQVVHMIRQSGDRVHLTIATPIISQQGKNITSSKTLTRVKPEPPKRDPTTTLTRNKTQIIKLMPVLPQPQQQPKESFDANKPLPQAPPSAAVSPTGSLNMMGRSISTNLSHFHSAQSLSSGVPDTQSISSISTIGSTDQQPAVSQSDRHTTQNQSSSSTTTLTTVAATKPQAPVKPNGIHLKAAALVSENNSIYQPAVITTNKRPFVMNLGSTSQPKSPVTPVVVSTSKLGNSSSNSCLNQTPVSSLLLPPPPPPPPPLPDFSVTPTKDRLSHRRTSAPINQSNDLIDRSRLLKKRDSLAAVSVSVISNSANGPSQMGAVAAACAAAANDRIQRQQLQQNRDQKAEGTSVAPKVQPVEVKDKPQKLQDLANHESSNSSEETLKSVNHVQETAPCDGIESKTADLTQVNSTKKPMFNPQTMTSASLGRKSSAQIIQQPKQNHMSQSQTLRPKPRRPAIPNYDDLPPPPPPLPPLITEHQCLLDQQQVQDQYHHHHHHHHHHQLVENRSIHSEEANWKRQSQELIQQQLKQQQQLFMRQQQLIMRQQQLRQQQLLQHQMKSQQQNQSQRLCQSGKHMRDGQSYSSATIARGPLQYEIQNSVQMHQEVLSNWPHPHHHHHSHNQIHRNHHSHLHSHPHQHPHSHPHPHSHQQQHPQHHHEFTPAAAMQQQQYRQHHVAQTTSLQPTTAVHRGRCNTMGDQYAL